MDVKFLFGWAKENGIDLPKNSDGNINIPASFELYNEWKKKGGGKESGNSDLIPYSEHEISNFSNSKRIVIAKSDEDIKRFIVSSRKHEESVKGKKMLLGKISSEIAKRIEKEVGIDLENFNIELRESDIGHAFLQHGEGEYESKRGQRGITEEDISKFSEIITSFDKVIKGSEQNSLTFIKQIEGNYFAVTYYATGNKSLSLKTLYIRKK